MNKIKKDKIGILGGSFDPPHIGHLLISKLAKKKFKMSKIIWLITKKNPLKKKTYFSLLDRKKRCAQLLKNERFISAKFIENKVKSNKLINSLRYMTNKKKMYYFIMGSDSLKTFHKWKSYKSILQLVKVIVIKRNKNLGHLKKKYRDQIVSNNIMFLNNKVINISSSQIKRNYLR